MSATLERQAFADRLKEAMDKAGFRNDSPTVLQRYFNAHGHQVTVHAARKWLMGEAVPTQDKLRTLANWLGVPADWLRFGTGEGNSTGAATMPAPTLRLVDGFNRLPEREQRIVQSLVDNLLITQVAA